MTSVAGNVKGCGDQAYAITEDMNMYEKKRLTIQARTAFGGGDASRF